MGESGSTSTLTEQLIPTEDLCAALAEIEALSAPPAAAPPAERVAGGAPPEIEPKPSEESQALESQSSDAAAQKSEDRTVVEQESSANDTTAAEPAPVKRLQFKMGVSNAPDSTPPELSESPLEQPADPDLEIQPIDEVVATPVTPLHKRAYRFADHLLDQMNVPFTRVEKSHRELLGWIALATTIVSCLTMIVMPILLPQRDAVSFLHEKREALNHPAPIEQADAVAESVDEQQKESATP